MRPQTKALGDSQTLVLRFLRALLFTTSFAPYLKPRERVEKNFIFVGFVIHLTTNHTRPSTPSLPPIVGSSPANALQHNDCISLASE